MNPKTRQWRTPVSSHGAGEPLIPQKEQAVTLCVPVALLTRGSWVVFANTRDFSTAKCSCVPWGEWGQSGEERLQLNHRGEEQALCLPSDAYADLEAFCFPISHLSSALMAEELGLSLLPGLGADAGS